MLKAKLPKDETSNARNMGGEKELVSTYKAVAYKGGEFSTPLTIKCYMGRSNSASVVHASIWVHGKGKWFSGHGSAGGYGYHKESAAICDAITSAGIELRGDVYGREDTNKRAYIGGAGDSAIREAIGAITRALGYRKFTIV